MILKLLPVVLKGVHQNKLARSGHIKAFVVEV